MSDLYDESGPYDPGVIPLHLAVEVAAQQLPEWGTFRQMIRTAAARIKALETEVEDLEAEIIQTAIFYGLSPIRQSIIRKRVRRRDEEVAGE